jgi:hypothetical protein
VTCSNCLHADQGVQGRWRLPANLSSFSVPDSPGSEGDVPSAAGQQEGTGTSQSGKSILSCMGTPLPFSLSKVLADEVGLALAVLFPCLHLWLPAEMTGTVGPFSAPD